MFFFVPPAPLRNPGCVIVYNCDLLKNIKDAMETSFFYAAIIFKKIFYFQVKKRNKTWTNTVRNPVYSVVDGGL